jgi:hypothetical protein
VDRIQKGLKELSFLGNDKDLRGKLVAKSPS